MTKPRVFYNLHVHTTASDGDLTPTEVVSLHAQMGFSIIAITDHDTIDGIDEAVEAGRQFNIYVCPGVEISIGNYEILAYGFNYRSKEFESWLYDRYHRHSALRHNSLDVISTVHRHGGLTSLAHPLRYAPVNHPNGRRILFEMLLRLKKDGLDAIETQRTDCAKEQINFLSELAKWIRLEESGGSDLHQVEDPDFFSTWLTEPLREQPAEFAKKLMSLRY